MFLSVVAVFLTDRGYDVVTARNGDAALAMASVDSSIRVVVMDVIMPGRSGLEILEELMQLHPHPNVIMMTARADDKVFAAVHLGAVDYVLKPFDFEALDATVAASVKRLEA